MSNSKLLKVMDYLINEQEDKARALLHQIFIEKARAINENLMSEEDDEEVIGGDEGLGLGHEIEHDKDEIESEEHYGDGTMEDMDVDDSVDDLSDDLEDDDSEDGVMDGEDDEDEFGDEDNMGGDDEHDDSEEERLSDLEQAIEDLKAEFEALKQEEGEGVDDNDGYGDEDDHDGDDDVDVDLDDNDGDEEEVDENWMDETNDLDEEEDWDDLEESLDLETIAVNAKKAAEVGSGKFARPESNTRSAVASNAQNTNGAKPVVSGKGKAQSGYERQPAPTSNAMKLGDNRRKKSTEGTSQVSKEGSTKALINKDRSEGFGAPNMKSPLGSGTTPKK